MLITLELPSELMKEAKMQAAAQGESLKTLVTRAVACELDKARHPLKNGPRVELPLFGDPNRKPLNISDDDIARATAHDDNVTLRHLSQDQRDIV